MSTSNFSEFILDDPHPGIFNEIFEEVGLAQVPID